jgi:hypothetical protein
VKSKHTNSTVGKFHVIHQICNLIPPHLVSKLAREHNSESDARTFTHWSHCTGIEKTVKAYRRYTGGIQEVQGQIHG